jgi:hypothetical protein
MTDPILYFQSKKKFKNNNSTGKIVFFSYVGRTIVIIIITIHIGNTFGEDDVRVGLLLIGPEKLAHCGDSGQEKR